MIAGLVVAHLVAGVLILAVGRRLGSAVHVVSAVPLAITLAVVAWHLPAVHDGTVFTERISWVSSLGVDLVFRLDGFSSTMAVLVAAIGLIVVVYASGYFADDESVGRVVRYAGFFTLFAGAMLGLVLADDVWTLFVFWELTSVMSFALIGLDDRVPAARIAAQRALLVTAGGGLVMLGGFVCLAAVAGASDLRAVSSAPATTAAQVGAILVLIGAMSKSAQFPFQFWLPGAMAAPTPVTAYLHSATMVKAGVVIVARFAPLFAAFAWWRPAIVLVGGITMLTGGVSALRATDAKRSLAHGTVSQLGMLFLLFGFGDGAVTAAAVVMLVAHAVFKSALFMTVGAVEHATGSRDLRLLSGVGRSLPLLATAAAACALSMIGVVPLLGFVAKESVITSLTHGDGWQTVALAIVACGSVLTTAYSIRLWVGLFTTKRRESAAVHVHHRPGRRLVGPVVLLGVVSLAGGLVAPTVADWLTPAATSLVAGSEVELARWPGLHLSLLISVLVVATGTILATAVLAADGWWAEPAIGFGDRAYARAYDGLLDGARRVTRVVQSGSLPMYVAVIFAVVVAALGAALAAGAATEWGRPVLADSVLQACVATLSAIMAVAVVATRRRMVAVLLLGGVGQGLTVLFLMYGAPDLALTQFMVETLMIVAFVLVLRHLPSRFADPPRWAPRWARIALSVAVGVCVAWFALAAGSGTRPTDVTDAVEALSLIAAGGRNVVNVTIVDFRGFDTLGEITVFGIAALGVANLVSGARRAIVRPASRVASARIGAQSMIFEQVVRMVFHLTLLVSLYVCLRGHNAPGGGFAGGLIAGAAFVFRILSGQPAYRSGLARLAPVGLIAIGLLLAAGTALVPVITGNEVLESAVVHVTLPVVGDVKLVSAAVFDAGVYLLVIGVVILVLGHLASRTHGASIEGSAA